MANKLKAIMNLQFLLFAIFSLSSLRQIDCTSANPTSAQCIYECPPYLSCYNHSQFCSSNSRTVQSCIPPHIEKDKQLLIKFCADVIQNKTSLPHPACLFACHDRLDPTEFAPQCMRNSATDYFIPFCILLVVVILLASTNIVQVFYYVRKGKNIKDGFQIIFMNNKTSDKSINCVSLPDNSDEHGAGTKSSEPLLDQSNDKSSAKIPIDENTATSPPVNGEKIERKSDGVMDEKNEDTEATAGRITLNQISPTATNPSSLVTNKTHYTHVSSNE